MYGNASRLPPKNPTSALSFRNQSISSQTKKDHHEVLSSYPRSSDCQCSMGEHRLCSFEESSTMGQRGSVPCSSSDKDLFDDRGRSPHQGNVRVHSTFLKMHVSSVQEVMALHILLTHCFLHISLFRAMLAELWTSSSIRCTVTRTSFCAN